MTENDRVRQIRVDKGLTMAEFGEPLPAAPNTISNIEKGNRSLTPQMRAAIVRTYGVNEAWLRSGEGDMYVSLSRREQLVDTFGKFLRYMPESFLDRLAAATENFTDQQWKNLADIAQTMVDSIEEK